MYKKVSYLFGIVLVVIVFYILYFAINEDLILPAPSKIFLTFCNLLTKNYTYKILGLSILRLLIAIVLAVTIGISLAVIASIKTQISYIFHPFIVLLKTTPLISIICIVLIIVGKINAPYLITFFSVLPIIYEASKQGIKESILRYKDVFLLDSNFNFLVIKRVIIPGMLNFFLVGLLQAIGIGFKILVMAEYLSQTPNSIGKELYYSNIMLDYQLLFSYSLLLIIIILVIELVINKQIDKLKSNIF